MVCAERRLIVNADDFGRSSAINQAVIRAHREGILTTASLMVSGQAAEEAVQLARQNPSLGVGLHLTLVCGRACLPEKEIPGLVTKDGEFADGPVQTGIAYFFRSNLVPQLRRELAAQFEKFHQTGLRLDHVNGHLHFHLHPTIFALLMENAKAWKITAFRLTRDPFWLNARLAKGRWFYRWSHWMIYLILSRRAEPALRRGNIRHTAAVFGLLQNAQVDEPYVGKLLHRLPEGDSELYSHPSLDEFRNELDALISPGVAKLVRDRGIKLIRYQDL
jgi:hopanoid biosynthesis associated protein HpnK